MPSLPRVPVARVPSLIRVVAGCVVLVLLGSALPSAAQDRAASRLQVEASSARHFDVLPSLPSALQKYARPSAAARQAHEIPNQVRPTPLLKRHVPGGPDPVRQLPSDAVAPLHANVRSFDGLGNADNEQVNGIRITPPDPDIDVGEDYIIETVNTLLAIYDKTGALVAGPYPNDVFFSGFGGDCELENLGDPIVLYDDAAGRWLVSYMSFNVQGGAIPGVECVAVSATSDPQGAWYRYEFVISTTDYNDYPKIGVGADAYYATFNMFGQTGGYEGATVAAFERDAMLAGDPNAQLVLFGPDPGAFGLLPFDVDGPVSGTTPGYFLEMGQDQLNLYALSVDWASPTSSTFGQQAVLPTAPFHSYLCAAARGQCIPQPNGQTLEAVSDRLMQRLQFTDQGSHFSMVVNHTVNADGYGTAGVRWYELRDDGKDGTWTVHQQGTYAPDAQSRWMGSVAMNQEGALAMVYSASSATETPSIRVTGRPATAPPGVMTVAEETIVQSPRSQQGSGRWGDYSSVVVDPTDGRTFWVVHQYASDDHDFYNWDTRIAAIQPFDADDALPPGAIADLAATPRGNDVTLTWTAPADDAGDASSGPVTQYDVRYDTAPITAASFASATPVSGVRLPGAPGTVEQTRVTGLDFDTNYHFAVRAVDDNHNTSLSNGAEASTAGAPVLAVAPDSLAATVMMGDSTTQTIQLTNTAPGTVLSYSFPAFAAQQAVARADAVNVTTPRYADREPQPKAAPDMRTGHPVVLGAGGPDDFGYRWIDSTEPGGPSYVWNDIRTTGTPLFMADEDLKTVALPFDFPFYGDVQSEGMVASNGYFTFTGFSAFYENAEIPGPSFPPDFFIAGYWDDLDPSSGGQVYVQSDAAAGTFTVQWTDVPFFQSADTVTFQIVLFDDGRIRFYYEDVDDAQSATIGIENEYGTDGLQVAFNTAYVTNGLAVEITSLPVFVTDVNPASGTIAGGDAQPIDVTINTTGLDAGTYSQVLGLATNDPQRPSVALPVALTVDDGAWHLDVDVVDATSGTERLTLGQSPIATDGVDASLGEQSQSAPDTGFGARFVLPDQTRTVVDYRPTASDDALQVWQVDVTGSARPFEMRWDPEAAPTGVTRLFDGHGGTSVVADVAVDSVVTVTDPSVTTLIVAHAKTPSAVQDVRTLDGDGLVALDGVGVDADLRSTSGEGLFVAERFDDAPSGVAPDAFSTYRWTFRTTGSFAFGADSQLRFRLAGLPDVADRDPAQTTVYQRAEPGKGAFVVVPSTFDDRGDADPSNDRIVATDLPGLGEFVFSSPSDPLPVELAAFEGTADDEYVFLAWVTASEQGNAGFEVQRRVDAGAWTNLGFVAGAGTTTEARRYQFTDERLPYDVNEATYRLKQVDESGATRYSTEMRVRRGLPATLQLHGPFPNPARSRVTMRYDLPMDGPVRMAVYNILGQQVATLLDESQDAGRNERTVDVSRLAAGTYFVRVVAGSEARAQRLTVVR